MRVLVTGGAGYIGSITSRTLLDAGHDVVVLDSLERGWRASVDSRAEFVESSVGDREALDRILPECDAVMHLAGLIEVAESQLYPERYFTANVDEPRVLLDAMISHGVMRMVFSSTAAVYGQPERMPIVESDDTVPVNAYGESKLAFERLLDEFAERGLVSIRFRYFNVGGAWPDGSLGEAHVPETHLIPRILSSIASGQERFEVFGGDYNTPDGTCVRDYVHVCDLADAHRIALERLFAGGSGGVFNLGSQQGFTNREVVAMCARVTGAEIDIAITDRRPGDPASLIASAESAGGTLGWSPKRGDLRTIIEDAWRWHLAHPNGYR